MKKKIKLLALILIFNLVNMIIPNEIFNCKAFAVEYTRDSFFDYSPGDRDNALTPGDTQKNCPDTLKAEDDEVINTKRDYSGNLLPMNIIYSYDGTISKVAIDSNSHTIEKLNDIKEWEVSIESDYPSNSKRDVTLEPLIREYNLNIEGDNSDKVEILDAVGGGALDKIDINYSGDTQYIISLKSQHANQYIVKDVNSVKIEGTDINYEYVNQGQMLTLYGTSIDKNGGPGEITIDVKVAEIRMISDVNVGDIIYPGDEIFSEDGSYASIEYSNDISNASYSSPVCEYYDVFSEDNTAFNGWKVISVDVSSGSISVKPQFKFNVAFEFDDDNAIAAYDDIFTTTDLNEQIKVNLEAEYGYKIVKCELLNDNGGVIEEVSYDSSSNSVTIPSIRELENEGIRLTDIHLKVTTELDSSVDPDQSEVQTIPITIKLRNK